MAKTIKKLIQDATPWIGQSPEPLLTETRDVALSIINAEGKTIHDRWPWDNTKIPQFITTVGAGGVVTFTATVDAIRAVRMVDEDSINTGIPVFAQDEVNAAITGNLIGSMSFQYLPDDPLACRRIQLNPSMEGKSIAVLALKRFVEFTPEDYSTRTFEIDRAETALFWDLVDGLRGWMGMEPTRKGEKSFSIASTREDKMQQKQVVVVPRYPMFDYGDN